MSGIYYMVIDGNGNELTTGVSEQEIWRVARRHADTLRETVYVSSSDGETDDEPVAAITILDVAGLMSEAASAGDLDQHALCQRALAGDDDAWHVCVRAIRDAQAAR